MPDRSTQIVIHIASVSQRVVNALVKYAGHKTVETFLLDKIVVGSNAILETLNKALFLRKGNVDDRLADWLESKEPQICLDTLNHMDMLLNANLDRGVKNFFQTSRSAPVGEKGSEAIRLFQQRRDCFHFLLTMDIWNREGGVQQQVCQCDVPRIEETVVRRNLAQTTQHVQHVETLRTQKVDLEKLNGILGWLNAWKCRDIHERTILLRQPDTCTWLPHTNVYKTWRNGENSFLWLNGKAGAGKSVLAASVIDGLETTLQDSKVLVFFYCDFRNERSTSASEVMRSILSQLLQQLVRNMVDPGDLIDDLIKQRDEGASTISNVIRLARYVSWAARQLSQQPFIVIDALDECKDVEELLDALKELTKGGVRLFVTSRPLQVIKDSFSGLPWVSMDKMKHAVSTDIILHVTRELDSHRRLRIMDADLKEEINYTLCEQADGMFRWVQCQLNALKQCVTTVRIRETLNNLPSDLSATYERILLGINEDEEGVIVRRALEWLVAALEPLQLSQIMEGLSVDLENRVLDLESRPVHGSALLDALGSLVTYDELTDVVILSHFSVKEYLIRGVNWTKHPTYHINEQAAHTQLALLCMCYITAYIKYDQWSRWREGLPRDSYRTTMRRDDPDAAPYHSTKHPRPSSLLSEFHPLLEYVQLWGFDHLSYVNPGSKVVLRAIQTLQSDVEQYPSEWEQFCERKGSCLTLEHDFVLYILVAFAPEPLLRSYIGHSKLKLKDWTNPLIYAAHFHKLEHARTLLSSGVSLNRRGWDVGPNLRYVLPFEIAVECRDGPVIDLFLTEGSPVPYDLFASVLDRQSHIPASIVGRLLQTDQFVEWAAGVQDEGLLLQALDPRRYDFPNYYASEQDIDAIQRRLVQIGCDPSARFNEISLLHAVSAGPVSTVKHMLSLNIPIPPDIILNASQSQNLNPAMIRLFLSRGCDVDVVSQANEDNALHFVLERVGLQAEGDCLESVQVLINAGCNPSACNLDDDTPLHIATRLGYVPVIEYLLSQHAHLPANILLVIPLNPFPASTIRFLVWEGADVHAIAANGNSPLHSVLAMSWPYLDEFLESTKVLLDAGCNPRLRNALGQTCLDVAARNGHLPVVEHFFSLDLPPSPSILLSVSDSPYEEATSVIKFLIDKGADINVTRPNGDTLLHLSMGLDPEIACLKRIKILVNAGCDARARNVAGKMPFHIAARQGYISVMEYLISVGTPVPSNVMLAAFEPGRYRLSNHFRTIRFLLEKQADIHIVTGSGDSLLHLATGTMPYLGHDVLRVVKLLVRAGCNLRTLNSAHETPLHNAARDGHVSVINYLLSLGMPLPADILLATSDPRSIHYLISIGADVSVVTKEGDTPLHLVLSPGFVSEAGRLENVKTLIGAGCNPRAQNIAGKTPLHAAAMYGFTAILEYFLSQDIPLPRDILLTSTRTIRFLLQRGIDIRSVAANYGDAAALLRYIALFDGEDCLECARFLVSLGWDLSSRDSAGENVIHVAAKRREIPTLKYLLSQNVPLPSDVLLSVMPSDRSGRQYSEVQVIRFLIREGASVNVTTPNGDTPLHLILRYNWPPEMDDDAINRNQLWKAVVLLLNAGADPAARNADGETPFDVAAAQGYFFKENFLRLVRNSEVQGLHS